MDVFAFEPEAVAVLAALPRRDGAMRVHPEHLTAARLYTLWVRVREEAGLHGVRIHDARHSYASQRVMNGVGPTAVGKLLGHRKRATTAIHAISTMPRFATPPPRRRPSSPARWTTRLRRRPPFGSTYSGQMQMRRCKIGKRPGSARAAARDWERHRRNGIPGDRRRSCFY